MSPYHPHQSQRKDVSPLLPAAPGPRQPRHEGDEGVPGHLELGLRVLGRGQRGEVHEDGGEPGHAVPRHPGQRRPEDGSSRDARYGNLPAGHETVRSNEGGADARLQLLPLPQHHVLLRQEEEVRGLHRCPGTEGPVDREGQQPDLLHEGDGGHRRPVQHPDGLPEDRGVGDEGPQRRLPPGRPRLAGEDEPVLVRLCRDSPGHAPDRPGQLPHRQDVRPHGEEHEVPHVQEGKILFINPKIFY